MKNIIKPDEFCGSLFMLSANSVWVYTPMPWCSPDQTSYSDRDLAVNNKHCHGIGLGLNVVTYHLITGDVTLFKILMHGKEEPYIMHIPENWFSELLKTKLILPG
jgi:hypothetical protein